MKILGIDPGTATGWAVFDSTHRPVLLAFGTAKPEERFYDLLQSGEFNDVDKVIYEDYKIRPSNLNRGFNHLWNNGPALQVIGAIKYWARDIQVPVIAQQPSIKPVAAGLTGLPYIKGKAKMHHIDAQLHACFYMIRHKVITPDDLGIIRGA